MKLRELEAKLRSAGFVESRKRAKGSHRKWFHPQLGRPVLLSGKPGDEAKPYQVKLVMNAIDVVEGDRMARSRRATKRAPRGDLRAQAKDYQLVVYWSEEDGAFLAEAPELPGCVSHGRSERAAIAKGRDAIVSWLEAADEFDVPVPTPTRDFSGQFVVRLGKSLHRDLVKKAQAEQLSLNQLVQLILRKAV